VRRGLRSKARVASRRFSRRRGTDVVHFLHVGKTGGTAVKAALRDVPPDSGCVLELHGHKVRLRDVPPGQRVVFFLRDPITRYVSSFYSRQRQGLPRHHTPWSREEEAAFARFTSPNDLAEALSSADENERSAARRAMKGITHVKSSYWDWFESEEYFRSRLDDITFVGFQETLDADFEGLKTKLGLPASLALPHGDVEAHKNPAGLDRDLSDTARRNLQAWYAQDYQFLALCRERADDINSGGSVS
jgi:hypothetical protein